MDFNSIEDFKKNFAKIYKSDVAPQLKYIEFERQTVKKKATLYATIFIAIGAVAGLAGYLMQKEWWFVGAVIAIIGFTIYSIMGKKFENKLKSYVMPLLMKAFGNFEWTLKERIDTNEIENSQIFERFSTRTSDDNFFGTYRGVPVEISESELTYRDRGADGKSHTRTRFKGVFISIEVSKHFTGHTIVRTRNRESFFGNKKVYEEVKLEDPVFQKEYFVDSNDQVEARFLLTPAFMERFKRLSSAFGTGETQCSFQYGKILIALSKYDDLFKLGDLNTPVTDTKQFQVLLDEFLSILEMIDHLKISDKTGI